MVEKQVDVRRQAIAVKRTRFMAHNFIVKFHKSRAFLLRNEPIHPDLPP